MPHLDLRAKMLTQKKDQGNVTVAYVNGSRRTFSAVVLAAGTVSGLKLSLTSVEKSSGIIDNVPMCTAQRGAGSTNCYIAR